MTTPQSGILPELPEPIAAAIREAARIDSQYANNAGQAPGTQCSGTQDFFSSVGQVKEQE
jgi:hypothetical protein